MKKITLLLFCIGFISVGVVSVVLGQHKQVELISPILRDSKTIGLNLWFPGNAMPTGRQVLGASTSAAVISAKSAFFVDTKTGQVLYQKNPHSRLPIASLVKVMTALLALENHSLDDKFTVTKSEADMEPDKMLLIAGEKLTLKELLYGIFLVSANDAAEVLAQNTTENRQTFLQLMNSKATQLGMKDTFYVNPTGLDEDSGSSYSSAYDLAILTRFAIREFPVLTEISKIQHMYLPITSEHQDYDMYTGINLLSTYPGVIGFKTGYTPEAGLTLITLARKNGHEVVGILLGSEDRRDEARALLDYSFGELMQ